MSLLFGKQANFIISEVHVLPLSIYFRLIKMWLFCECTVSTERHKPLLLSFSSQKLFCQVQCRRFHSESHVNGSAETTNVSPGKSYFLFENWFTIASLCGLHCVANHEAILANPRLSKTTEWLNLRMHCLLDQD